MNQSEAKPKFIVDPNAVKYKLVFSRGYDDKLLYKTPPKDNKEKREREMEREKDAERRGSSYLASFLEQLNDAGAQGYRLISNTRYLAIMKLDEVQREYTLFETHSNSFFSKSGFGDKYAELSKQGFSLVDHLLLSRSCETEDTIAHDAPNGVFQVPTEHCSYLDRFLLERVKGDEKPRKFQLARHVPRWGALKGAASLATQINDYLAMGLYPTHAFSKYEILLQPISDNERLSIDKSEAQVVTGDVRKKVNELAQQGYRLALAQHETAVMYRHRDASTPVSYIWLHTLNKNFESELAQLQDRGAIYKTTYPNVIGKKFDIIFEQPAVNDGKRRTYKALKFVLQSVENVAEQRVEIDLAPSSKETVKTLNSLVNEGFVVRDLFLPDNIVSRKVTVSVLLERSR